MNVLILLLVCLWAVFALVSTRRRRHAGGCCGAAAPDGCSGCAACGKACTGALRPDDKIQKE